MTYTLAQVCVRALDAESSQGPKTLYNFHSKIYLALQKTCQQHLMSYSCLPVPVEVLDDDVAEPALTLKLNMSNAHLQVLLFSVTFSPIQQSTCLHMYISRKIKQEKRKHFTSFFIVFFSLKYSISVDIGHICFRS